MSQLYNQLATVYEAMYYSFINYEEEYEFYSKILETYQKDEVLEIGCGTGNLAKIFIDNNWKYLGMDYSQSMLDLAESKCPKQTLIKGDMRSFSLQRPVKSAIITGRTISYLITNQDLNNALASIHKCLTENGILAFDFIDAYIYIPDISKNGNIVHHANYEGKKYKRESLWTPRLEHGMDITWYAKYFQKNGTEYDLIGEDQSIARAFTLEEITIFLQINGFKILDAIQRASYAFPTYVMVAQKL